MRNLHRALLAGSLGFVVAFVAGCGASGTGLLSDNQASTLQNQLNRISSALSSGDCGTVRDASRNLASQVATLPPTVNPNLRQAITSEANQVTTLSVQDCHPVRATPTPTTQTTTQTQPPTTTQSTTQTTTQTQPPTTSTTTTSETTPTTPGNNSGGGGLPGPGGPPGTGGAGGGNGNGNGNG